jgi:hypothetical protein
MRVDETTQACDKAQAENGILRVYVDNLKKKYKFIHLSQRSQR